MKQVTDTGAIEAAVDAIIADNPEQAEKAKHKPKTSRMVRRSGDESHTGGKANPKAVNEMLRKKLLG